jgi:tetratricopeptide (TPR) repeat protein
MAALTTAEDRLSRYELLVQREKIYEVTGDREKRLQEMEELDALTRPFDDSARMAHVAMRRARYAYDGADYPLTIEEAQRSISLAGPLQLWEIALTAYGLVAAALFRFGQPEQARDKAEDGLTLATTFGTLLDQSLLYNHLGLIHFELRNVQSARESLQKSLELARETNDLRAQTRALGNLAMVGVAFGDLQAAQRMYEESLLAWGRMGNRQQEVNDLSNLGWVSGTMGEFAKGRGYLERQLRLARELGDLFGEAYGLMNLSAQLAGLGEDEAASELAGQALALTLKIGDRSGQAFAFTYLGHSQFALGQFVQASDSYQEALDIRRALPRSVLITEPLAGLARTALATRDLISAQSHTDEILEFLETSGTFNGAEDPLRVYYSCYLVLAAAQDPRATLLIQAAHTQLTERAENIQDLEIRRGFLGNVEINRLIAGAWEASRANK